MKALFSSAIFCLVFFSLHAQVKDSTGIKSLPQLTIKGYYNPQEQLRAVGAVSVLDSNSLRNYDNTSLVSAINSVSGVRMEERSPGSYRLSLRGSLLRSPFGIRNIKIYIDDFPLTDAGGNSYFNALDVAGIGSLEVHKGPESSNFGATTGGAVLVAPITQSENSMAVDLTGGSYGLFHQSAKWQQTLGNYRFNLVQGYQESGGYRENSRLKRLYFQTFQQFNYSEKGYLKAFLFFSDMNYRTPGGLTAAQLATNPRAARPATATLPGAVAQQAGIFNKTIFGGLSNTYYLTRNLKHVLAIYGSNTDFKNPFITNFEKRRENTLGLRTLLNYDFGLWDEKGTVQVGIEASKTTTDVTNFGNNSGIPTTLLAADDLTAKQQFSFLRLNFDIDERFLIELGASLNFYSYDFRSVAPINTPTQTRKFEERLMPKLAISYLLESWLSLRSSVSKGYSSPTLAEVRSSDNVINTDLQAEYGWNYEAGFRIKPKRGKFYADVAVYHFRLINAIVRRLNSNDIEYFINAGGTKQLGAEVELSYLIIKDESKSIINQLKLNTAYTYSRFSFRNFSSGNLNFSGNRLTGVPKTTLVTNAELLVAQRFSVFVQHQFVSKIPLNDANTAFANEYHLIDLKTGIRRIMINKLAFDISFGVNNLFNRSYSLGNDLNAASGRFYNPAAGINFYTGISAKLF